MKTKITEGKFHLKKKRYCFINDKVEPIKFLSGKLMGYPIIILGDTNCTQLDIDKTTINDYLISPLESIGYNMEEALPNEDIDRIFVANRIDSHYKVVINGCEHGVSGLSDHRPFIMNFDIVS